MVRDVVFMVIDSVEVEVGGDVDIIQHIGSYRLTHYCFHIHGLENKNCYLCLHYSFFHPFEVRQSTVDGSCDAFDGFQSCDSITGYPCYISTLT